MSTYTEGRIIELCPGCRNEIDSTVCCCGAPMDGHGQCENHTATPMGCVCGYPDPEPVVPSRESNQ